MSHCTLTTATNNYIQSCTQHETLTYVVQKNTKQLFTCEMEKIMVLIFIAALELPKVPEEDDITYEVCI